MGNPSIIRTEFASAEDAADVYGVSHNRIATLRRALNGDENKVREGKRRVKQTADHKRGRRKTRKGHK